VKVSWVLLCETYQPWLIAVKPVDQFVLRSTFPTVIAHPRALCAAPGSTIVAGCRLPPPLPTGSTRARECPGLISSLKVHRGA
jgi:hypothetical protein